MKQAALSIVFAGLATVAQSQTFICDVKSTGDGFIPETLVIALDLAANQSVVYDDIIDWAEGEPLNAKMRTRSNGTTVLSWAMTLPTEPMRVHVSYRAILAADKASVVMRGTMRNAENSPKGNGSCKLDNS